MTAMLTMMMTTTADDVLRENRDRYDSWSGTGQDNEALERKDRPTSSVEAQFPFP